MKIRELLKERFLFFDGAMGTMMYQHGFKAGEIPELYNIHQPHIIENIHREYLKAGSNILTTNTFGANQLKLESTQYSVEDIVSKAVIIAKEAIQKENKNAFVALDIGPTGQLMEPLGTLSFNEAYDLFKQQVIAGKEAGCDLILIETMSDLYEVKAAVLAAKENSDLPVFCTMTFGEDHRTLTGADPLTMITLLEALGVDALGMNCSLGPKELMPIVKEVLKYSQIPVMVQPNAGLPKIEDGKVVYDITKEAFSDYISQMGQEGVSILGGCCGTTPEYIEKSIEKLKYKHLMKKKVSPFTAICSGNQTVVLGEEVKIIGERINPTGKKKFKEALKNHDIEYILKEAIDQKKKGADILDVNVGLPDIDENEMMQEAIKEIQSIINLPLQIDSANPHVIEKAVRIYNGKPIINSVNGKQSNMEKIFPIVKKYGACVIGLTLDENGIPSTCKERFEIAQRIVNEAKKYGIDKKDIIIDCLVLTASAQQKEVLETLKAVRLVKEKLGVKTTLGISNVSFGLPKRQILNKNFLAMALMAGLDAPILNPMSEEIMETIYAFKVLAYQDHQSKEYIKQFSNVEDKPKKIESKENRDLKDIIIDGMKEEATQKTEKMLIKEEPLEVIDKYLIPALNTVGSQYEKGEIFLPQLIQSAETVKKAFEVLKEHMKSKGDEKISNGKVVLATVKGDIHDIGKNIVKVLMENYGFEVIDLGKDVPIKKVVDTVRKEKIQLVGLSALMTTTVKSMEETIDALRKNQLECKVLVGGAVLTKEYADQMGADYYAKDAMESVKIAQKVFNLSYE